MPFLSIVLSQDIYASAPRPFADFPACEAAPARGRNPSLAAKHTQHMSESNVSENMRALSMRNEMEEPLDVAECMPCETCLAAE